MTQKQVRKTKTITISMETYARLLNLKKRMIFDNKTKKRIGFDDVIKSFMEDEFENDIDY